MEIIFLTLNPEFFSGFLEEGIIKNAIAKKIISIKFINFRDYSILKHSVVDDTTYGGGSGMLLKVEPIIRAFESIELLPKRRIILPAPAGEVFNSAIAKKISDSNLEQLIFICGRYEGIDERVIEILAPDIYSIGDFVLSNGELAALVMFNCIVRNIDGVLGNPDSLLEESFTSGLLEYPQYTRPEEFRGLKTPSVLLTGNHREINAWRKEQAIIKTKRFRSDLLKDF